MFDWYKDEKQIPNWIYDAMKAANIKINVSF